MKHANEPDRVVPFVSGFAFVVKTAIWRSFGGFDVELGDYGNENEFCIRIRKAGLVIKWTKHSYIHHIGEQSYGSNPAMELKRTKALEYIRAKHPGWI
jgi:GT2 family glycosyltransferase